MSEERKSPVKLKKDLIQDSVVEIRFEPAVPKDQVLVKIFEGLYKDFPNSKDVQVPPLEMRAVEPFKYLVTNVLHNNEYSVGFGGNSIVFNCINGYKGWQTYFGVISNYLSHFFAIGLFSEVVRVGLRYVNVFADTNNLSKNIQLDINFHNIGNYTAHNATINLQLKKNDCQFILNIVDTALVNGKAGSVLDIDVTKLVSAASTFENICTLINEVHREEKEIFINILDPEFLETLGPSY